MVPPVAELLMLKQMQIEVNERTQALESSRENAEEDFDPIQDRMLRRLALRQGSIVDLTEKIAADLGNELKPPVEEEEDVPEGGQPARPCSPPDRDCRSRLADRPPGRWTHTGRLRSAR